MSKLIFVQITSGSATNLGKRLDQRNALTWMKATQMHQTHAVWGRPVLISSVKKRRNTLITQLNAEIRALDKELKDILFNDPAWGQSARRFMIIPGIGLIAAA